MKKLKLPLDVASLMKFQVSHPYFLQKKSWDSIIAHKAPQDLKPQQQ